MKTTFTLLLTFFTMLAYGQHKYVPGQYTTLEGESVSGYIDDQNWNRNPKEILFKTSSNSNDARVLSAKNMLGFSLSTGDRYVRYIGNVEMTPDKLGHISDDFKTVVVKDSVFLRLITAGPASLYHLKDNVKDHFFISVKQEEPVELIYRMVKQNDNGSRKFAFIPMYKGMLKVKLTECPKIENRIERTDFTMSALVALVNEYNSCSGTKETGYQQEVEKVKWHVMALVGVNQTAYDFSGSDFEELTERDYSNTNYAAGMSVLTTLPRAHGKWGLRNDILYKPFIAENTYESGSNLDNANYTKVDSKFDLAYLGIHTSVHYRILNGAIRPFINVGMSNSFMLYDKSSQTKFRRYYSIEKTTQGKPLSSVRKYEQGLQAGAGIELNKFMAEVRYEIGNGFSEFTGFSSTRNTIAFYIGYFLK